MPSHCKKTLSLTVYSFTEVTPIIQAKASWEIGKRWEKRSNVDHVQNYRTADAAALFLHPFYKCRSPCSSVASG